MNRDEQTGGADSEREKPLTRLARQGELVRALPFLPVAPRRHTFRDDELNQTGYVRTRDNLRQRGVRRDAGPEHATKIIRQMQQARWAKRRAKGAA